MELSPKPNSSPVPQPDITPVIHTMPEKFLATRPGANQSAGTKGGHKIKTAVIIILVIVVVFLAVTAGALFFFLRLNQDSAQQTNNLINTQNQNIINTPLNNNLVNNINNNQIENTNLNTNTNPDNLNSINNNLNSGFNTNNLDANSLINLNISQEVHTSLDSDSDLLSDVEETQIYGTVSTKPDTDNDGYIDGQEVIAGYNPRGSGSIFNIVTQPIFSVYNNSQYNYSIAYPAVWQADALDDKQQSVLFTSETGEFIEITIVDNPEGMTASAWYTQLYPELRLSLNSIATSDAGLAGILSAQGYTAYYADAKYFYIINYNFGTKTKTNFNTTFTLMHQSLRIIPEGPVSTNANSNLNTNSNNNGN